MKVKELIAKLKDCPQDLPVYLYYDGDARLIPDMGFQASVRFWDEDIIEGESVVLGMERDIYNIDDTARWGNKPVKILFKNDADV